MVSKFERGNTIKSTVIFKSGSSLADPSGNKAYINVIRPNDTYLVSAQSADRDGVGTYHYYFETNNADPLGLYLIEWYGYNYLGGVYGNKKILDRESIEIVEKK